MNFCTSSEGNEEEDDLSGASISLFTGGTRSWKRFEMKKWTSSRNSAESKDLNSSHSMENR